MEGYKLEIYLNQKQTATLPLWYYVMLTYYQHVQEIITFTKIMARVKWQLLVNLVNWSLLEKLQTCNTVTDKIPNKLVYLRKHLKMNTLVPLSDILQQKVTVV